MLHREVGQRLGDELALVDGVLQVFEHLLLAEHAPRVGAVVVEEGADGVAEDAVGLLL